MTLEKLTIIDDLIRNIHVLQGTPIEDLIDALTGDTWDEEEAGEIKRYMGVYDD